MKALVILPFVALVQEKAGHLSKALAGMHCKVKGYAGNEDAGNCMPLSERYQARCEAMFAFASNQRDRIE